jgi:hypothetical protein
MITVTIDQFEDLRRLAVEAAEHTNKDKSYQRGVNLLGKHLLNKLNQIKKPSTVCLLCKKDPNAKNQ